jgi:hypothetical protein
MQIQKYLDDAKKFLEDGWEKGRDTVKKFREKISRPAPHWLQKTNDYFVCLERTPALVHPLLDRGDGFLECLRQRQIDRSTQIFRASPWFIRHQDAHRKAGDKI